MHIFVTAGTGFVGGAVVRTLLTRDHCVTALVRNPTKAQLIQALGATLVVGDMLQPASYIDQVKKADVVIHCAQLTTEGRVTKRVITRINEADEIMTRALADACLANNKPLIYTSGYFCYGDHGDAWITESTPANPTPLGVGHQQMVNYLFALHQQRGLRVTVLTAGFVYGPGGLFKTSFYDTLQKGQLRVFGKGQNYWSPVHVDDLAQAFALASEGHFWGENFNIVDDQPIQLRELVDQLTDHMAHKRVGSIPPWLIGLLIGAPLVESLTKSARVSNEKAGRMLGWAPRYATLDAGLPDVIAALTKKVIG